MARQSAWILILCSAISFAQSSQSSHPILTSDRKRIPSHGSRWPLDVNLGIYLESLGNFRDTEMSFDVDLYLYLSWRDPTLNHTEGEYIMINDQMVLQQIWLPDVYFANARTSRFHTVTVPNFNMFIYNDGTIGYSTRVSLTVACNLNLMNYPLDKQLCLIKIISYAYITTEMNVTWFRKNPIRYNPEIGLPEFAIDGISHDYCDGTFDYAITAKKHQRNTFSCLIGAIQLRRSIGYHIVQSYIPTGLIVIISWVSFWIDRRAVPARVSLSFTTLLTLSTLGNGLRYALPPVSYAKSIDYWFGACMMFVFGALLEYAVINSYMRRAAKFEKLAQCWTKKRRSFSRSTHHHAIFSNVNAGGSSDDSMTPPNIPSPDQDQTVGYNELVSTGFMYSHKALTIDKNCRVLFPLAFLVFNVIYWLSYMCIWADE